MKFNLQLFLAIFLVSFLIHFSYFRLIIFVDQAKWINRTVYLSQDIFTSSPHITFYDANHDYRYGSHPGTAFLLPAALLYKLGLSGPSSLLFAIIILTSFCTASIAAVCHYLRPSSLWWLAAAIILFIHPLYFYSTPTNAIIGPITALLFLLVLVVYEQRHRPLSVNFALFTAFILGLGLSTRLHDTVFIGAPLITFMGAYVNKQRLALMILASAFFAFILNPFLWFIPIEYLKTAILRTSSHIIYTGTPGFHLTPLWVLYYTPLTIISLSLAILSFILARKKVPVSSPFLLTLCLITTVFAGLFLTANYQTLRYFYPLIFTWDILLPLFLLSLSDSVNFSFITSSRHTILARQSLRLFIIVIIIFGFGFLTAYNLLLPGSQGMI